MPTGHQHGSAGNADRTAEGPRAVVAAKAESILGEAVEVRSLDLLISMRPDGVRPLIVGEEEDDVGAVGSRRELDRDEEQNEGGENGGLHLPGA